MLALFLAAFSRRGNLFAASVCAYFILLIAADWLLFGANPYCGFADRCLMESDAAAMYSMIMSSVDLVFFGALTTMAVYTRNRVMGLYAIWIGVVAFLSSAYATSHLTHIDVESINDLLIDMAFPVDVLALIAGTDNKFIRAFKRTNEG